MKMLIVDDHVLIREALQTVLRELRFDAVVLEACDWAQAMRIAETKTDLELILLDLGLPDRDGFDALREMRERFPGIAIVVLSASKDRDTVLRALDIGALGFIPKSATRAVMLSALQLVLAGGVYVPPEILQPLLPAQASDEDSTAERLGRPAFPADLGLTERQVDVLALMMQGKSNKAICRDLDLAEATVKNHVTAVLKALHVTNRTEAVLAVTRLGWKVQI